MAAQWPLVAARLVALLPTLPGWSGVVVFDGPPVTSDSPSDYATVGYVDGDLAGSYLQTLDLDGVEYAETGDVRCQITCQSGNVGMPAIRSRVFALADAVEASIRADRRLGVLSPQGTTDLAVDVQSRQNAQGAAQSLVFTVSYFTVT